MAPYKDDIVVAAESSFAWYWLADLCRENGIAFILGHALYMKAINGGKVKNDRIDSKKIALLVLSGMFPQAYVYPRENRSLRDLLRRRLHFVYARSKLLCHIQLLNYQENKAPLGRLAGGVRKRQSLGQGFSVPEHQKSVAADLELIEHYDALIHELELHILNSTKEEHRRELSILRSVNGIGEAIGLTILLETGDINRFKTHQQFASYSRLVKCAHESGGKRVGMGGPKIGNPYLKNAFSEAAHLSAHHSPVIGQYLQRLQSRHGNNRGRMILAHKLGRTVYYMLKRGQVFDEKRFLNGN